MSASVSTSPADATVVSWHVAIAQRGAKIVAWITSSVAAGVSVGVGVDGQPLSSMFTAAIISPTMATPSPSRSSAGHGAVPLSTLATPAISSATVTTPLPSQSPLQTTGAVVAVGVDVLGAPGVGVAVGGGGRLVSRTVNGADSAYSGDSVVSLNVSGKSPTTPCAVLSCQVGCTCKVPTVPRSA